MSELVTSALGKLSFAEDLVLDLKQSDFPHEHANEVLDRLTDHITKRKKQFEYLKAHPNNESLIRTNSKELTEFLEVAHLLLGFVDRSSKVINAFEMHGPFIRLVQEILGADARLLISSEWTFSPFTYTLPPKLNLNDIVFIGMPASESENGLIMPLAGHELGHNIWRSRKLSSDIGSLLSDEIINSLKQDDNFQKCQDIFSTITSKDEIEILTKLRIKSGCLQLSNLKNCFVTL